MIVETCDESIPSGIWSETPFLFPVIELKLRSLGRILGSKVLDLDVKHCSGVVIFPLRNKFYREPGSEQTLMQHGFSEFVINDLLGDGGFEPPTPTMST